MNTILGKNDHSNISSTLSSGFVNTLIDYQGQKVNICIWDTTGQEAYRSLIKEYFRNTDVAIIVVDLTNVESFESIGSWIEKVHSNTGNTKCDFFLLEIRLI